MEVIVERDGNKVIINNEVTDISVEDVVNNISVQEYHDDIIIEHTLSQVDIIEENILVDVSLENTVVEIATFDPNLLDVGGRIRISDEDIKLDYPVDKITWGLGIDIQKLNSGNDERLQISLYEQPSVSLSGGQTYEIGYVVPDVFLTWSTNKNMISRELSAPVPINDRDLGAGASGSYDHFDANITNNTQYIITVSDGRLVRQGTTMVDFKYKRFRGTSSKESIDGTDFVSFTGELADNRQTNFSINGNGQYLYYTYPSSWGPASFYANGLMNTAWIYSQVSYTNQYGVTENYNVYRSLNIQNGEGILIEVK